MFLIDCQGNSKYKINDLLYACRFIFEDNLKRNQHVNQAITILYTPSPFINFAKIGWYGAAIPV